MTKVTYNNRNAVFFNSLKKSVDRYFEQSGLKKTGNFRLYIKSVIFILTALALYATLLFVKLPLLAGVGASVLLGLVSAFIGFNVMHDANHSSYSSKKWVNNTLGLTLNALGGNSFIWKQKHNIIHHTYTNIDGIDDDIAKSPFIRMCSSQRWVAAHRVQHLYTPLLYAFSSVIWVLYQDFEKYYKRKICNTALTKMKTADHILFWSSKVLYILFYLVIPIMIVGWKLWLLYFICMHIGLGFTLSIVFQLAHVVEDTVFEFAEGDEKQLENEWAVHQVKTTSNFAANNKILSWFVGGLNYQIEHHLFPRISHVHYPAISRFVKEECQAFQLPYNSIPTMNAAIASHFRFIKSMGQKPSLL
ncbi:fatty acid desaturase family protein [Pinibacter soli]|uniref:Acyl-CoA desaturase n=1 Tax=Pinibacter soli TaxID=3044211 RepID=A0ABT6R704_9BACT|nr:acyl-CoA desaturase [Pinibacter soli]MDI3318348.1 acyl-CoA desaturase [Pinibacter soli]